MIAAIRSTFERAIEKMGDQGLRINRRNSGYNFHRTGGKQITRSGTEPGSYDHSDSVCVEPLGKKTGNMFRRGNKFSAQNTSLFLVGIYKKELFRMTEVLR